MSHIAYSEKKMAKKMESENKKRKERDDEKNLDVKVDQLQSDRVKRIKTENSEKEEKFEDTMEIKYDNEQLEIIKELFCIESPSNKEVPKGTTKKNRFRVTQNRLFSNVSHDEAEKMLKTMRQGDAIFRPSKKDRNYIVATWKVTDNVFQHIPIREEDKPHEVTIGRKLWIENEQFEDLDGIISKYIKPVAAHASELIRYKRFQPHVLGIKEKAEEILKRQKKQNPEHIPYIISASKKYPGNFLISYLPRAHFYHEYISISPAGYKLRGNDFTNLGDLLVWFKEHSKEPKPKAYRNKHDVNKNIMQVAHDFLENISNSLRESRQESDLASDAVSSTTTRN